MYELIIERPIVNWDNFVIDWKTFIYNKRPDESPLSIVITEDQQELLRRTFDCLTANKVNCFLEKTTQGTIRVYMKPTFYGSFTYAGNSLEPSKTTN